MQPKTTKTLYWIVTVLLALAMLADGVAGVLRIKGGQEAMRHLGYPIYALTILGLAKILGVIALLQPAFRTLKEWAYAGFTINFIGAAASHAFSGDGIGMIAPALIVLAVLFISYYLWKKVEPVKAA